MFYHKKCFVFLLMRSKQIGLVLSLRKIFGVNKINKLLEQDLNQQPCVIVYAIDMGNFQQNLK